MVKPSEALLLGHQYYPEGVESGWSCGAKQEGAYFLAVRGSMKEPIAAQVVTYVLSTHIHTYSFSYSMGIPAGFDQKQEQTSSKTVLVHKMQQKKECERDLC